MDSLCKKELEIYATKIRMGIIEGTYNAKAGHPGGSLSAADVFAYLYEKEMRVNPKEPKWDDRDRLVLSKGHCAPGLYAALAYKGFFPVEDLKTLRHIDSYLQGHPNMNTVPGIDMSTGSLGQGISVAVGMAKGADVTAAVQKAERRAKKNMITFNLNGETICHEVETKVTGAHVLMKPAAPGTGIIAGGVIRSIIGLTSVKNLVSKSLGSTNKANIAYAVIEGLRQQVPKDEWLANQGKKKAETKKAAAKEEK